MRRRCLNEQQNRLVLSNMGLAYEFAAAFRWHPRHDDIIQSCQLGLCEAALRWDPGGKAAFSTYAYYWMRHCTDRELKDLKLPVSDSQEDLGGNTQEELLANLLQTPYIRSALFRLIHELPENERHVVLLKYPLDSYSRTYTDVDIAVMLECSRTWVGYLRRRAFCKLREELVKEGVYV